MEEVLRFALIGLGLGAMYSLASQGLVLIYRGSGVLNFAQGAVGMLGAYVYYEARTTFELPFLVSALIGIVASGIVGVLVQVIIMRRLKNASPLARIVATRQEGTRIFYRLENEHASQLVRDAIFQAEHSLGGTPRHHHADLASTNAETDSA